MSKLKLAVVASNFWGGNGYFVSEALNKYSDKIECRVIQANLHPFGFPHDILATVQNQAEVQRVIDEADALMFANSEYPRIIAGMRIPENKVIAQWHVGTAYRQRPPYFNDLDKKFDKDRGMPLRFFCWDLLRLTGDGKNNFGLGVPLDMDFFKKLGEAGRAMKGAIFPGQFVTVHLPSSTDQKRTDLIQPSMFEKLKAETKRSTQFLCSTNLPYHINLMLKAIADVYIDHMNVGYGAIGTAATEAAAMNVLAVGAFQHTPPEMKDAFAFTRPEALLDTLKKAAENRDVPRIAAQNEATRTLVGYKAVADRLTPMLVEAIEGLK